MTGRGLNPLHFSAFTTWKDSAGARPPAGLPILNHVFPGGGAGMLTSAWINEIDWLRGLEFASGGIAATGLLWQTSIWLSVLFIQ
jgi:hypothetical protein